MKKVLVTGAAGFIGAGVSRLLLERGTQVFGVDNLNDYYDVRLKQYRLNALKSHKNFSFVRADIEKYTAIEPLVKKNKIDAVINLAARAGVPYSLKNPFIYVSANILGSLNLLELCRHHGISKYLMASSSSVYSGESMPFTEKSSANKPVSPYAASKKGAEMFAYTYHYLYGIDVTIARYFTVYGPAGRPDMSYFRFIRRMDEGKRILINGDGNQQRDFTYIDDIADGTTRALVLKGFHIVNLGSDHPYSLKEMIRLIERNLGKKACLKMGPRLKEDVRATWADISAAKKLLKWKPRTSLEKGIRQTVRWYLDHKKLVTKLVAV